MSAPRVLLALLILGYAIFFSVYSLQRHATLNTFAADLSYIDQPMWNTLHGRFLERTLGDRQAPRVAKHLEPILLPLSLAYLAWDDVRAILILQTLALALGAAPVFWIARRVLGADAAAQPGDSGPRSGMISAAEWRQRTFEAPAASSATQLSMPGATPRPMQTAGRAPTPDAICSGRSLTVPVVARSETGHSLRRLFSGPDAAARGLARGQAEWLALAFSAAYLLYPALQAANLADFHADPFVVTPLLCAFWYATQRRHGRMWLWALIAMVVKENLPTLTAMLGLYVIAVAPGLKAALRQRGAFGARWRTAWRGGAGHGVGLVAVSLAWFYVATFVIVAPLAHQVYGTAGPIYLANRYTAFGGGLGGLLAALGAALREPARLGYLGKLFAPAGWLALLAPGYLLLGLPVLVANFLSNYPGQFSGEQHYSAPLVAALIIAAIYGARRLMDWVADWVAALPAVRAGSSPAKPRRMALAAGVVAVWLLAWALGQQYQNGWTPLARFFQWPDVTAHDRLLTRFTDQIPAGAAVSASPAVHPHVAHREKIYLFPTLADAAYILVDVPGDTGMHPSDVQETLDGLVAAGSFGIVDAADGYVLLKRGGGAKVWPAAFYDFARAGERRPAYPLDVRFGDRLKLVGYDVVDDPRWRQTRFRFYWQTTGVLPVDTTVGLQVVTPAGDVVDDASLRPMPALLWYPPSRWQPGETVVTESVPWYLPRAWAPVLAVSAGGQTWPPQVAPPTGTARSPVASADGRLRLPAWARLAGRLRPYEQPLDPLAEGAARFGDGGWQVRLAGWAAPVAAAPGSKLQVSLRWQADGPAPRDDHVFVHLRAVDGQTVATGDAPPTWFVPQPPSRWTGGADGVWTAHVLTLPDNLALGRYDLVAGWYDWQTGARLPLVGGPGNPAGDEIVLGPVTIARGVGPQPDISCLMVPASCASQE